MGAYFSGISLGISLAISLGLHACMKGLRWTVVQICISFCDIHLNTAGLEAAAAGGCSAGADASQQSSHNPRDMHTENVD